MNKIFANFDESIVIIFCVIVALVFSACGSSDEQTAMPEAKKAPYGAGDTKKANREMEEAVRAMLNGDEQLKAAQLTVNADVTRNQVTLTGTVTSEELRRRAVDLAKSAQAGVVVSDKIVVKRNAAKTEPS